METVTKHFVTFVSPGTFFAEETTQPIDTWDVREAMQRSRAVVERYDQRPHSFYFSTRKRGPEDLDSKQTAASPRHYLGGKVETYAEVVERNDPKEEILRSNMRINGIARVVTTLTPWRHTAALHPGDVVLDADGNVVHTEPVR